MAEFELAIRTHTIEGRRRIGIKLRSAISAIATVSVIAVSASSQKPTPPLFPKDAKATCVVSTTDFAAWFGTGRIIANGGVKPSDSLKFSGITNGDFYRWSLQMFLWLTSPSPRFYGGAQGGRVLESPLFYGVTPPDAKGNRSFVPYVNGGVRVLDLRSAKAGPHAVIESRQAEDAVLMAQHGSLVYYSTLVNDIYAYFVTANKNGVIFPPAARFPTTLSDLNDIATFGMKNNKVFMDTSALALEVKTAWVEADGLSNPERYITMRAIIPTLNKTNRNRWVVNGTKTTLVALVGMHVVGSVKGHPEMIWATFEHVNNAPSGPYSYFTSTNATKRVPQGASGSWLFCARNPQSAFNVPHMRTDAPVKTDIVAIAPKSITPSNTIRTKAFGTLNDPAVNTDIISINNSVRSQLLPGDIRANYFLAGATWTPKGAKPTGTNGIGSNHLLNATMETYVQNSSAKSRGANCFSCHQGNMLGDRSGGLSHIYGGLKPLF